MGRGLVNGRGARYKDLSGVRFGRLIAHRDVGRDSHNNILWECGCDCGNTKAVPSQYLQSGTTTSCGCLQKELASQRRLVDLSGKKFGSLLVLSRAENSPYGRAKWNVLCDCGEEKAIIGQSLTSGKTTSCGCHRRKANSVNNTTHGMTKSPEYRAWASMIARCRNEGATGYHDYGARGITVCERWIGSFETFFADMGPRPSTNHSLDRFPDVNGNYEPGNVRWATKEEQERNKRNTLMIDIHGSIKPLVEWCEIQGIKYTTAHDRIFKLGWSHEEALEFKRRTA